MRINLFLLSIPDQGCLSMPSLSKSHSSWSYKKKWVATASVLAFTFISPISSSMVAPATEQIAVNSGSPTRSLRHWLRLFLFLLMVSTFPYEVSFTSLIYLKDIGPLFLGPMSEIFGRLRLIQSADLFFLSMSYFPFCLLSLITPSVSLEHRMRSRAQWGRTHRLPLSLRSRR